MKAENAKDLPDSPGTGAARGYAVSWSLNGMIYLIFLGDPASVVAFRVNPMDGIWSVSLSTGMTRITIDYSGGASAVLSAIPIAGGRRIPLPVIEPFWSPLPAETRNIVHFIANNYSAYWRLNTDSSKTMPPASYNSRFKLPPRMPAGFDWDAWASKPGTKRFLAPPRRRTESSLELIKLFSFNIEKDDLKRGHRPKQGG